MNLLPKIKTCPCCSAINIVKTNGLTYECNFQSLTDWTLKKNFNCRKCKVELGLFINNFNQKDEKLVWIDFLKCEETHLNKLNKLQKSKIKYKENHKKKEYFKAIKEIETIQNQIRLEQTKIKIKVKIQSRGMSI